MGGTLLRVTAWAVASVLAMTMSWFGVHRVLAADPSDDAPQAIPIDRHTASTPPFPSSSPSPWQSPLSLSLSPSSSLVPTPVPPYPAPSSTASQPATNPPATNPPRTSPPTPASLASVTTDVQSYQLTGGRVVLETTETSARLVSATPEAGWQVQAWQAEGWLRVDFSRDGTTSSCFVTWNGHPPMVQTT